MKKITLSVALLLFGGGYFANAQVGIGTPEPATSSMLDIVANDKGVLIPRVELTNTTTFFTSGTQVESLLVYNTKAQNDVTPGFYYWVKESATTPHWERIVNQTQLDEVIKNLGEDLTDIKNLLNYIVPTNPINTGGTTTGSTTVVYDPTTGAISYVSYSGGTYTTTSIDLTNLIKGAETKTFFRKVASEGTAPNATNVKYYYFSEQAIQDWLATPANTDLANMPVTAAGVFLIDAVGDVVNNFESVLNQTTNYGGETLTIEQIINKIAGKVDGNVIYKNIGTAPAVNWVFQYWDAAQDKYVTVNLTDLVGAAQSKTLLVKTTTANAPVKQYYLSETFIVANTVDGVYTAPTEADINGWTTATLPVGIYEIDIVKGVSTNFETILKEFTTIEKSTGSNTYYTVKEYIEYISSTSIQDGVTKIVYEGGTGDAKFQTWNATTKEWVDVVNAKFKTIVQDNETVTTLVKNIPTDLVTEDITYAYSNEEVINDNTIEPSVINITADMVTSITNNKKVQDVLNKFLSQGGNAYYTRAAIAADAGTGQAAIPADTFYTIERNGDDTADIKVAIDLSGAVINVITNNAGDIKNILGDNINNTVTKTGDTFNGGDVYIYANTTTIAANTAVTSGITIPAGTVPNTIIGIKVIDTKGISSNVTDIVITGQKIDFNIGTGNMYNILGAGDYDVIVEFTTAPVNP